MKSVVISSGHGAIVGGAVGYMNERSEAVKVVDAVYDILKKKYKGSVYKYHESKATTQAINLSNIVNFHNSKKRDLDVSVHFNSAASSAATGTECLYYDAKALSTKMSKAMANSMWLKDRGPKERRELYFLRNTNRSAILLEVCFVSNKNDVASYRKNFVKLCEAIASVIANHLGYVKVTDTPVKPTHPSNSTYYKPTDKKGLYRIIKDCYLYKSVNFDVGNRDKLIKKGEAVTALEIVKYGSAYRLKTKYGYVTANKEFVQKV